MERKIGEIFEYNGEWYQCVEGNCAYCSINDEACEQRIINDVCKLNRIFKKLEKVGEPFTCNIHGDERLVWMQEYKLYDVNFCKENALLMYVSDYKHKRIAIEIKQTKEDMKEKKLNLKPFSLELAKAGKPVCTRDGRKARIICFDRRLFYKNVSYPILAVVERSDGEDDVCGYNEKGKVLIEDGAEYKDDLMMLPEKKEGWINIYDADTTFRYVDGRVYETKYEAVQKAKEEIAKELRGKNEYVDTIKIN